MNFELNCTDPRWADLPLAPLAERATVATLAHLNINSDACEISLLACDDTQIATLNAGFRDKDSATNVLSWPTANLSAQTAGARPDAPRPDFTGDLALGDIAIAWETCQREADAAGTPIGDHVTHLIIHGVLHLLGYDHIRDPDATLMQENEVEILGKLGIGDPYNR